MNVSEITPTPSEAPTTLSVPAAAPAEYPPCDECGAVVDHDQRYCVSCGAHRRHVADPAARYLAQATARSRAATAPAGGEARSVNGRARTSGLVVAVMLALVPAMIAVGVVVGRSSNNGDAQLLRELSASQAQLAAISRVSAGTTSAATVAAPSSSPAGKRTARHAPPAKAHSTITKPASAKAPTAINGTASAAQQQQGAAIVSKLQHTSGTSYLNQLPSQVVVP
jgi:hypothetical protein